MVPFCHLVIYREICFSIEANFTDLAGRAGSRKTSLFKLSLPGWISERCAGTMRLPHRSSFDEAFTCPASLADSDPGERRQDKGCTLYGLPAIDCLSLGTFDIRK